VRHSLACAAWLLLAASASAGNDDVDGKELYKKSCARCHGEKGSPTDAMKKRGVPSFADPAWQAKTSDEAMREAITVGRPQKLMPSFQGLTSAEIDALVRHVRTLQPKKR
jgi:mono/diheme cytochrome c family protein